MLLRLNDLPRLQSSMNRNLKREEKMALRDFVLTYNEISSCIMNAFSCFSWAVHVDVSLVGKFPWLWLSCATQHQTNIRFVVLIGYLIANSTKDAAA